MEAKKLDDSKKIYLQVENPNDDANKVDVINVFENMSKKRKIYKFLFALAICFGVIAGLGYSYFVSVSGKVSYSEAVLNLSYDGVEKGLDPNGSNLDINMLKSPVVLTDAFNTLGLDTADIETIRENIEIVGVIPEDAVDRITVINQMALDDASNYEKILDVTYFPSQYKVKLYKNSAVDENTNNELLNAILNSYREYFIETYANTEALSITGNLINYENYDYLEAIDMLESQADLMISYVSERKSQDSSFRAVSTGLSFGDITASLNTIKDVDLDNLSAYVENISLTKDKDAQRQYLEYKIRKANLQISEDLEKLSGIQETIDSYEKDQIVIVGTQEDTTQITQSNDYYDSLVQQKVDVNNELAECNRIVLDANELLDRLNNSAVVFKQAQFDYADGRLETISNTLNEWISLIETTTEEYYDTTLFSNAVAIAVPAQYTNLGGTVNVGKNISICVGSLFILVLFIWSFDGLKTEIKHIRANSNEKKKQ